MTATVFSDLLALPRMLGLTDTTEALVATVAECLLAQPEPDRVRAEPRLDRAGRPLVDVATRGVVFTLTPQSADQLVAALQAHFRRGRLEQPPFLIGYAAKVQAAARLARARAEAV